MLANTAVPFSINIFVADGDPDGLRHRLSPTYWRREPQFQLIGNATRLDQKPVHPTNVAGAANLGSYFELSI